MLVATAIEEDPEMTRKRLPPVLDVLLPALVLLLPGTVFAGNGQGHAHAAGAGAVVTAAAAAEDTGRDPGGHGHAAVPARDWPRPPAGTRWQPDASLREGMARLRASVAALEGLPAGRPDRALVIAQAEAIDDTVAWLFAHCRLPPAPDAALHHLLAAVLDASARLRNSPVDPAPVADLREALAHYPHLFED